MKKTVITFLATGAYAGYSPVMPGTAGTVVGMFIAWLISTWQVPAQLALTIAVIALSIYVSGEAEGIFGSKDPGKVVIDEIAGVLVAVFLIPFTLLSATIIFLLFRFFDIVKPWPVSLADQRVKGGFGVTLDDLVAGVYAAVSARILIPYLTPFFG
jgi:phosphatidylglycerophosphatase A